MWLHERVVKSQWLAGRAQHVMHDEWHLGVGDLPIGVWCNVVSCFSRHSSPSPSVPRMLPKMLWRWSRSGCSASRRGPGARARRTLKAAFTSILR